MYNELDSKIQIILCASEIPDGTVVTKQTGTYSFKLRKSGIPLYSENGTKILCENITMLQNDSGFNAIPETMKLKMHFDSWGDAYEFMREKLLDY